MRYIYYIDGQKFITNNHDEIPHYEFSSPNENTPAYENLKTGQKLWCLKGYRWHRLTGPALIHRTGCDYWIEGEYYETVKEWLTDHPNPDLYFHNIGVFTETDKILWFLQN
jgi:hypothetical protein